LRVSPPSWWQSIPDLDAAPNARPLLPRLAQNAAQLAVELDAEALAGFGYDPFEGLGRLIKLSLHGHF
jgi:hypothetical protein